MSAQIDRNFTGPAIKGYRPEDERFKPQPRVTDLEPTSLARATLNQERLEMPQEAKSSPAVTPNPYQTVKLDLGARLASLRRELEAVTRALEALEAL